MPEQVLEIELPLRVELLEHDLGALAQAALDRLAVEVELVADPHVHAAAGHAGTGPGADIAEDDGTSGRHVLEGEALGVGAVDHAAGRVVHRRLGLPRQDHVRPGEPDAEPRVGRALHEEPAALGPIGE